MHRMYHFLVLMILISASSFGQTREEKEIRGIMQTQLEAWNRGDVEGFMEPYWKNDSLMFIGKTGITYGWENTLQNYKKGYPDTLAMGKLAFTLIRVERFADDIFHVIGKWHLTRKEGNLSGHFTVVFKKIRGRWMIVSDHSS